MMEKRQRNNQEGSSDGRAISSFWRKFWRLNVPNKIKIFGWRLYHDGLPIAMNLIRRGCAVNDSCMLCQIEKESSTHIFKECWYVKAIFAEMNLPDEIWNNECRDVGYWLWLCEGWCTKGEFETLLSGLWICWFNRNQVLHDKEPWDINMVKQKLKHMKLECDKHLIRLFDGTTEELVSAKNPLVFCDGSWCGETKKAGLCAVLKHENMIMRVAACCVMNVHDANTAEGLAIKLGMELASGEHLEEAIIITDSAGTIGSISNGVSKSQGPYDWLPFCQSLWCNRPRWKLGLIPRDLNFEADSWARKARVQNWSWSDTCAVPTRVHL